MMDISTPYTIKIADGGIDTTRLLCTFLFEELNRMRVTRVKLRKFHQCNAKGVSAKRQTQLSKHGKGVVASYVQNQHSQCWRQLDLGCAATSLRGCGALLSREESVTAMIGKLWKISGGIEYGGLLPACCCCCVLSRKLSVLLSCVVVQGGTTSREYCILAKGPGDGR